MREQETLGRSFSELSELQASLKTLQLKGVALEAGRFSGSVSTLDLGDVVLEVVRTSPALLIEAASFGRSGCLLLLEGASAARWDGKSVDPCDIASLHPCGTLTGSFHDPCTSAFVSTDAGQAEALFGTLHRTRSAARELAVVRRSSPISHARVSGIIRAAEERSRSMPGPVRSDEGRRALRATLLEAVSGLFSSAETGRSCGGRAAGRHRTVRRADEFLCANPVRPIYTEDLCEALGVSASAMHEAFHSMFGISPHRYLKLRRMSLVRATLLSSAGPWRSVKAAALSYGFWHLGQFAHDYRAVFGELPSATLARANGSISPRS